MRVITYRTWGMGSGTAGDWRERAACRDHDPELFYPVGRGLVSRLQALKAKLVCGTCMVRTECLAEANELGEAWGVWGGLTPEERQGKPLPPLTVWCQRCETPFGWDPEHPYARLCHGCDKRRQPKDKTAAVTS